MTATATAPRGKPTEVPITELQAVPEGAVYGDVIASIDVDVIDVGTNVRAGAGDVAELADSIRAVGILQPIRVRVVGDRYELVYGQRRLAAARLAGLARIPALIDDSTGDRSVEQLVENLQRADLNPLEEGRALAAILAADKKLTQAELAKRIGRSAPYVSNALRILETAAGVQAMIADGRLSGSHAKALAGLPKGEQERWAEAAARHHYSVHDLEQYIARDREYQADRKEENAAQRQQAKERLAKALERLPDKGARIRVSRYGNGDSVITALKKAGYTDVEKADFRKASEALDCDCGVTGIEVGWNGGLQIIAACVSKPHQDAKWKAQRDTEAAARDVQERIRAGVGEAVGKAAAALPGDVGRVLLWIAMDWSLNDWVKEHKGDRKKPDAWGELAELDAKALAAELSKYVAKGFSDRYGVRLDWPAIAEAFGVSIEQPPAKGKRGKAAKADG